MNGLVYALIGLVIRMLLPWLVGVYKEYRKSGNTVLNWNWRYLVGQAILFVIVLIIVPLAVSDLEAIMNMDWQLAIAAGYGAGALGRDIDKWATGYNA